MSNTRIEKEGRRLSAKGQVRRLLIDSEHDRANEALCIYSPEHNRSGGAVFTRFVIVERYIDGRNQGRSIQKGKRVAGRESSVTVG